MANKNPGKNPPVGIPYARVDEETGEQICPVCKARIATKYDETGEAVGNPYGEHYEPSSTHGASYRSHRQETSDDTAIHLYGLDWHLPAAASLDPA